MSPISATEAQPLEAGSEGYRKANLALFVAGFACFAMLYGTQPILPLLVEVFGVAPATASLSVSAGTITLAAMLIPASVLSDRFGRQQLMRWSLVAAALFATLAALVTDFTQLLVLRGLLGIAIAGVPAAAMAYLGEEIAPSAQGRAMGLYIAGNAFGGMSGRFISALLTDLADWRFGLAALGILGAIAALVFWRALPVSHHFRRRSIALPALWRDIRSVYGDRGLPWLFVTAFLLMGSFVGFYNFLGFRLVADPFGLSPAWLGAIFLMYVIGSWASAWAGRLADRIGRRNVLWVMISVAAGGLFVTLADHLLPIVAGLALFTFGFFGAHSIASGWVSRRAGEQRALAAAIYLSSYYMGGSVLGSSTGLAWTMGAWPGVVAMLACTMGAVLLVSLRLRAIPRKDAPPTAALAA
ncbi:MAG: MFS transporter [Rhodocyclaceae bacterium]|nr:MFS transporter [Rhodocyclaceae bacterium]